MGSTFYTVFAFALLFFRASATAAYCSKLPFAFFTPLAKHPGAQSFCTSKYPIPRPTCFFTTTIPSTTTISATATTEPVTVTIPLTTGDGLTVTFYNIITPEPTTLTETSTVATTITTCAPGIVPRNNNKDKDKLAPIFSSLQKQAASFVKTLCSCIETTPGCSTSTITTRPTLSTTATVVITNVPISTVTLPNTVIVTIQTTLTLAQPTSTTTITQTATSTYCAPPKQTTCAGGVKPLVCDVGFYCTSDYSCGCLTNTEGDVACADTTAYVQSCDQVVSCASSADCGTNEWCVTNLCCPEAKCLTIKLDTCANVQARSRIFKAVAVREPRRGDILPPRR